MTSYFAKWQYQVITINNMHYWYSLGVCLPLIFSYGVTRVRDGFTVIPKVWLQICIVCDCGFWTFNSSWLLTHCSTIFSFERWLWVWLQSQFILQQVHEQYPLPPVIQGRHHVFKEKNTENNFKIWSGLVFLSIIMLFLLCHGFVQWLIW